MKNQISITTDYFRQYRKNLGFTNQADVRNFFGAKDIVPNVDLEYIKLLNKRLFDIVQKINFTVSPEIRLEDLLT